MMDMGVVTIPMSEKEIREARALGIKEEIIYKMAQGLELEELEKAILPYGRVYVRGHTKEKGKVVVRPQLRMTTALKKEKLRQFYYDWEIMRQPAYRPFRQVIYARKILGEGVGKLSPFFSREKDLKEWLYEHWYD